MTRNKKVPIERQFNGTNNLLMRPIKNKIATFLYNKRILFSSRLKISCNITMKQGDERWLGVA